jgi:hypothetical protein
LFEVVCILPVVHIPSTAFPIVLGLCRWALLPPILGLFSLSSSAAAMISCASFKSLLYSLWQASPSRHKLVQARQGCREFEGLFSLRLIYVFYALVCESQPSQPYRCLHGSLGDVMPSLPATLAWANGRQNIRAVFRGEGGQDWDGWLVFWGT